MQPDTIEQALFTYRMLIFLNLAISLVNGLLTTVLMFRRKIPLDKELSEYVKVSACERSMGAMVQARAETAKLYAADISSLRSQLTGIERSIGRLEGKIEDMRLLMPRSS